MLWRCLNRAKKVRGHIYMLEVSMWPLSIVCIYTYMNGHFAGLVHAPQLSLFYINEQHQYHTSGGVKLVLCLNHSLLMSMWVKYQPWHYNQANKWQSKEVLSLLSNVLLFTFFVLYTVIHIRFILLTQCLILFCDAKIYKITFYLKDEQSCGKIR